MECSTFTFNRFSYANIHNNQYIWFPCGLVRGALANLGINCLVVAEATDLPQCKDEGLMIFTFCAQFANLIASNYCNILFLV